MRGFPRTRVSRALTEAHRARGLVYDTCMQIPCTQHTWQKRLGCRICYPNPDSSTLLLCQDQPQLCPSDPSSPLLPDVAGGSISLLTPVPGLLWNHPSPAAWWQPRLQWWVCGQRFLVGMGLNPWGWGMRWSWGDRIAWLWAQILSLLLSRFSWSSVRIALAIEYPHWWMLLEDSPPVCTL